VDGTPKLAYTNASTVPHHAKTTLKIVSG
jgi:hypothetical protein